MNNDFQVGDQVRFKSGGPTMTIESIGDYYGVIKANCEWFDSNGKPQDKLFSLTSLIIDD